MPDFREGPAHVVVRSMGPFFRVFLRVYFDFEVESARGAPLDGGVIIASNHFSHIDPVIVSHVVGRNIRFLALDELFGRSRLFDRLTGFFGAIPIDRSGVPVQALRRAIGHIDKGGAVGVFPEGRRVTYWGEDPPQRGAAWLAWVTGAPLVPIAIHGTDGTLSPDDLVLRRTSVRMWVGEPIWWHEYADRVNPLTAMMDDWHRWMDQHLEPWHRVAQRDSGPNDAA